MPLCLSSDDKINLLKIARSVIEAELSGVVPAVAAETYTESLREKLGAFVTLHSMTKYGRRLRGCIGRMQSDEALHLTVRDMALAAAFSDPRFPPLARQELQHIDIEISVLSPFVAASHESVCLGKHGVYITCRGRSSVFLPQVAREQGWDRETLLAELCGKAGLPPETYKQSEARLYTFTALIFGEASV